MADSIHSAASELSAIVPEVWSARTYEVLKNRLIFRGSINEDYTGDISDLGDTVNIHSIPEFAEANELAEGARNDADSVTVSNLQLARQLQHQTMILRSILEQLWHLPTSLKLKSF